MIELIWVATYLISISVPAACPSRQRGCSVAHWKTIEVVEERFFFKKDRAETHCKDKRDCKITEVNEEKLNEFMKKEDQGSWILQ